jgi:hypothetical protein
LKTHPARREKGIDYENNGYIRSSRVYNVSRLDENYEIAYEPTWVEV